MLSSGPRSHLSDLTCVVSGFREQIELSVVCACPEISALRLLGCEEVSADRSGFTGCQSQPATGDAEALLQ